MGVLRRCKHSIIFLLSYKMYVISFNHQDCFGVGICRVDIRVSGRVVYHVMSIFIARFQIVKLIRYLHKHGLYK